MMTVPLHVPRWALDLVFADGRRSRVEILAFERPDPEFYRTYLNAQAATVQSWPQQEHSDGADL